MPSKETDVWKDGIDKQDELLRYDEKKMLTLSSKIQDTIQQLACERRHISGLRFFRVERKTSAFAARVVRRLYNTSYGLINCYLERSRVAC